MSRKDEKKFTKHNFEKNYFKEKKIKTGFVLF